MKRIVYIGNKPLKVDNVAKTGLTWTRGDIHEVEDEPADILLSHPTIWADASAEYSLMPELNVVSLPEPKVVLRDQDTTMDNYILDVPSALLKKLHSKELIPIFMSPEDADDFEMWKLDRDTAPKETDLSIEKKRGRPVLGINKKTA